MKAHHFLTAAIVGALAVTSAHAQEKTPGCNTKIPEKIMTPDKVETRIGTLEFFDMKFSHAPPNLAAALAVSLRSSFALPGQRKHVERLEACGGITVEVVPPPMGGGWSIS